MKSLIRLLKKRRSGGFTLVEMVISVALIGILLGGMMLFISPVLQTYKNNQNDITAENTTTCIQEYISRSLRNSYRIAIFANTNYSSIKSTAEYTDRIKAMNSYCNTTNGPSAVNKTVVLKCLSLRYDDADNKYYLYNEKVDMTKDGALETQSDGITPKGDKVFADILYEGLYIDYMFSKPRNGDYVEGGTMSEFREDALQMDLSTYRDTGYSSPIFRGTGITEMRQIKGMLADGGSADDYNVSIEPAAPKAFADTTSGSRDIYIYYISRQYAKPSTP